MKQSISICRLLITGALILFLATMAQAETRYVIDKMQITFRTGPGNDRKILSILNSDQQVTFLQPEGEWAKVGLPDGKEGWVLQRYLSAEVPCRIRIKDVSQSLEALKTELEAVQKTNQQLEADKVSLAMDLKETRQTLAKTKQSHEKLKKDAAGFLELKARHDKTVERLSTQTQKANALDKELNNTLKKQNIRWFLGGGGVLLLGFIMGFSSKRQKRHSSLL
jgi:SH3 domain protein